MGFWNFIAIKPVMKASKFVQTWADYFEDKKIASLLLQTHAKFEVWEF